MDDDQILRRLAESRILPVLRTPPGGDPVPVVELLAAAGFGVIELTYTSPDPLGDIERARAATPGVLLGMGTVTTIAQLLDATAAGADFVVMPVLVGEVLDRARRAGLPVVGAGLTPSEIFAVAARGAVAAKVFPAGRLGPSYLRDLAGPFPDLKLLPTGGISTDDAWRYLDAGAVAVGLGGQLIGDACSPGGDLRALEARATALRGLIRWPDIPPSER